MMKFITSVLLFFIVYNSAFAQFGACRDTTQIQSNSACGAQGFFPVCSSCNGKITTYRNECFANTDGVFVYNAGPCEEFAVDFYPNVLTDANSQFFRPTILSRNKLPSTIFIMDVFGVIYNNYPIYASSYNTFVQSSPAFQDVINLADLKHGLYLFVFSGGGQLEVRKFVRVD